MAGALGRLAASLVLDINDWTVKSAEAGKVAASMATSVDRTMRDVETSVRGSLRNIAGALAAGFSIIGLTELAVSSENALARMKDLGREAGTTAAAISRFDEPARAAGLSLDAVATAIFRMGKASVEANDSNSKAALALKAIGISVADLKGLKPDEMFELVARKLAGYTDGLDKNAVMQVLFNKSGREMNIVVGEINERTTLAATLTNGQADAAKKLDAQILTLKMTSESFWRGLVSEVIPALTDIIKRFNEGRASAGLFEGAIAGMSGIFEKVFGSPRERWAQELAGINADIAAIKEWQQASIAGNVTMATRAEYETRVLALIQRRKELQLALNQAEADGRAGTTPPTKPLNFDPTKADAAASSAMSDSYIASLQREIEKLSLAGVETLKYREALVEITKIKKAGGIVDEETIKNLARTVDAAVVTQEAYKKLAAGEAEEIKSRDKMTELARANIDQMVLGNKQLDFETSLLGLDNTARALAINAKEREKAVTAALGTEVVDATKKVYDDRAALIAWMATQQDQLRIWTDLSGAAGRFFGDLLMNGKSALDKLKQEFRTFFQDLIALFAQKFILQIAASVTGLGFLGNAAASAGQGTVAGSLLGGGMDFLGGAATSLIGGTIGTGLGAGFSNLGLLLGGQAASIGGLTSGLMAALPALGAIGVAILGIAALAGAFSSGGGLKDGGSFYSTYGAAGNLIGSSGPRFFTPSGADAQVGAVGSGIAQSFFQTITALGGTSRGLSFALGFDTDPRGTAQNRVSGGVYGADGSAIFLQRDRNIGRDANQIGPEMQLTASRMVLAAIQSSQLPAYLANVFNGLTPSSATQAQIDAAMKQAAALKQIFDVVTRNPMQDVATAIAASQNQFQTAIDNNNAAIRRSIQAYDGSSTAAQNLATATTTYYNAQMQLLAGVTQASQAIRDMFGQTFRSIEMSGMDRQGQYNYLQAEAARLQSQALASRDPATIQRLAQQINADISAAWALLSPEQQNAQRGAFLQQGRTTQQAIEDRLAAIQKEAATEMQRILNQIKDIIGANTESQTTAANTQMTAANTNVVAANTPRQIVVVVQGALPQVTTFR